MKARLPQGMGGGAPSNMNQMIRQAQKMQEAMEKAQEELNAKEYEATAGGGMVAVTVSGKKEVTKVTIKPEVVDPEDVEILEDMIAGAVNEALRAAEADSQQVMGAITGGMRAPGMF